MVPQARNPFFTGRTDVLTQIETVLAGGTPAALSSLGGTGKTQTATEYAYRHRSEYRHVLWVGAMDATTLREGFAAVAGRLGLPEAQEADQGRAVEAVKAWLEDNNGWLLVLDNADDPALLRPFLPADKRGHVLLTTRAHATGALAEAVPILKLSEGDGALLLLRRVKKVARDAPLDAASPQDKAAALAISREVEGLPLALDQAGAFIEETPVSPARYLELYQAQSDKMLAEYGAPEDRDHASVWITFSLAFQKVAEANLAAGELVRCCAFLAPDAIPEEVFTEGDAEWNAGLGPFGVEGLAWEKIVGAACRYSLLSRDVDAGALSIHRLVQTVIQHELDEDARRVHAERVVGAVSNVSPDVEFSKWPLCDRLLPHQRVCIEQITRYGLASTEAAFLINQVGF